MLHLRGDARKGTNVVNFPYRMPDITASTGRVRILALSPSLGRDALKISMKASWPKQMVETYVVETGSIATLSPKRLAEVLSKRFTAKFARRLSASPTLDSIEEGGDSYRLGLRLPPGLAMAADDAGWKALGIPPLGSLKAKENIDGDLVLSPNGGEDFTKRAFVNSLDEDLDVSSEGPFGPSTTLKDEIGVPQAGLRYSAGRLAVEHNRSFSLNPYKIGTRGSAVKAVQECLDNFKKSGSIYGDLKVSVESRKLSIASDFPVDFTLNKGAADILHLPRDFSVQKEQPATGSKWEKESDAPSFDMFSDGYEPPVLITSATHVPFSMSYVEGVGAVNVLAKMEGQTLADSQYFSIDGSVELIQLSFVDRYMDPVTFDQDFQANLTCSFTPLR